MGGSPQERQYVTSPKDVADSSHQWLMAEISIVFVFPSPLRTDEWGLMSLVEAVTASVLLEPSGLLKHQEIKPATATRNNSFFIRIDLFSTSSSLFNQDQHCRCRAMYVYLDIVKSEDKSAGFWNRTVRFAR